MDVVKTNIERIGGNIELASTAGSGTTVRLKIPLTLAIIPALVVGAGSARFAIPQVKVVELVRLEQGKSQQNRIELLQGRPVYRLRGQILPLIELASVLKIREDEPEKITSQEIANIVVLNSECGMFGLIVDQIVDSADIVVKPLSEVLKKLSVYAGATIMGDGTVVLILDVLGLSTTASLLAVRDEANARKNLNEEKKVQSADAAEYLLVEVGAPSRYAIPLCLVNRLEEFDESQVEMTGDQRVVRYRDGLLPLISVSKFLNLQGVEKARLREPGSKIPIVVMGKSNRIFGLEMEAIKDVVQIDSQIDSDLRDRDGILGSLIRDKEVIVVIDALAIIDKTLRSLAGASKITTAHQFGSVKPRYDVPANSLEESVGMRRKLKILLAEDTPFFRKHIKKALEEGGYSVTAAVNGDEALKCLESSSPEEFALVLSDIEMPVMDGFELAKRVRQNDVFAKIPMVALTTRFRNADIAKGSEAGFNAYLEKFNGDTLINNIDALLGVKQAA